MTLLELEGQVLSVLPLGEKAIYGKYLDLDNKYRFGELYWQAACKVIRKEAQDVKSSQENCPREQQLLPPVINAFMNYMNDLLIFCEEQRIISGNQISSS